MVTTGLHAIGFSWPFEGVQVNDLMMRFSDFRIRERCNSWILIKIEKGFHKMDGNIKMNPT